MTGAGLDIDMRVDAALADQLEVRKAGKQCLGHGCTFAKKDETFCIGQAFMQDGGIFGVIRPDCHVMTVEPGEGRQGLQCVEPVVQNMDPHQDLLPQMSVC